ncbi:serine/threonine-protein phosphatase 7 long form-like protein [Senna tora]|uniref:Serine/threonine-protein phosphatase 7 long form-like protein n=1 Tax=Senna tora TaxID=362788 RepID=A0A834T1H6_9FABA|nr:serine/threonine-protein phosphatase 7 long form-like protein [Senna tora]
MTVHTAFGRRILDARQDIHRLLSNVSPSTEELRRMHQELCKAANLEIVGFSVPTTCLGLRHVSKIITTEATSPGPPSGHLPPYAAPCCKLAGDLYNNAACDHFSPEPILGPPRDLFAMHNMNMRNKNEQTWFRRHKDWNDISFQWPALVCTTSPATTPLDRRSNYMQWYQRRTRRWIHPDLVGDVTDRTMSQVQEQGSCHHPFSHGVGMGLMDLMQALQTQLPRTSAKPFENPYIMSPPSPSRGSFFCEGGLPNAFQGLCTPRKLFEDVSQCQSPSFGTLYSDPLVHQDPPPMDFVYTFDAEVSSLCSDAMGIGGNVVHHSPPVFHTGLTFDFNQPPD